MRLSQNWDAYQNIKEYFNKKMKLNSAQTRKLVDKPFSLQWCKENLVIPLLIDVGFPHAPQLMTIAIGNFSYLATVGEFIKRRAHEAGYENQIVERSSIAIQTLLDRAAEERLISGFDFDFDFDFDDSDEQIIEENALDLSTEMLGSKIPQAYAKILCTSTRSEKNSLSIPADKTP